MLTLLCVGKIREPWILEGIAEYQKRIRRYERLEILEVAKGASPQEEGIGLLAKAPAGAYFAAFDEKGEEGPSEQFAMWLGRVQASLSSHVCFAIGGAGGLSHEVKARAQRLVSLSKATFPHQLFRLIAVEQIYRALAISNGLPYHK